MWLFKLKDLLVLFSTRILKPRQLNWIQLLLILSFATVFSLLWHVKMSVNRDSTNISIINITQFVFVLTAVTCFVTFPYQAGAFFCAVSVPLAVGNWFSCTQNTSVSSRQKLVWVMPFSPHAYPTCTQRRSHTHTFSSNFNTPLGRSMFSATCSSLYCFPGICMLESQWLLLTPHIITGNHS